MARVLFSYGVQSQYDAVLEKSEDTIYFITDTQRIYKGSTLVSSVTVPNVVFTTNVPEPQSSLDGVLYVATVDGQTTLYIKVADAMQPVGGGVATDIADGIVSFGKLAEGLVASDLLNPDDSTLPTTSAVANAIESAKNEAITSAVEQAVGQIDLTPYDVAFTDVSAEPAPEGTSGTVLKFTAKDGSTKEVTIADIFLASAEYDSETHNLTLTLNDASSTKVTVNLDALIGNSLSDVTVGEDEAFTVELGEDGTVGGFKTGDQISTNTSVETIIKTLLRKQVSPTYVTPTVSVDNNSGTSAGNYEFGTTISPNFIATFTQNDGGELTSIQINKDGSVVGEAGSASPYTVSDTPFQLTAPVSYQASASYAEGEIKNDNLGEPYPETHISAGSVVSNEFTYTPYRKIFYGGSTSSPEINSEYIRTLNSTNSGYEVSTVIAFQVPQGCTRIVVAYDQSASSNKPTFESLGMVMDVSQMFESQVVSVDGAENSNPTNYTVWVYEPAVPYQVATNFRVTLN